MKKILFVTIVVLLSFRCGDRGHGGDQGNGSDLGHDGSADLDETELYNFGLEPKSDVYDFFSKNISVDEFSVICEETRNFRVISIIMSVNKDSLVTFCEVKVSDVDPETTKIIKKENSKTEEVFKKVLFNKKNNFSFIDHFGMSYSFRINLNRFCK